MFDRLATWLKDGPDKFSGNPDELQLAVAALLIEAARIDDAFDERERTAIQRLLQQRFGLGPEEARQLEAVAERNEQRSAQLFGFIRTINERIPAPQRIEVIEMLWEVAYADGVLDPLEDTLLRRIGGMIDVSDHDRGLARIRVARRLGIGEEE
jgi:uncharacterized tellurite resistance protein B-like protein